MLIGVYLPGTSPLHRLPAGPKLLVLAGFLGLLTVFRSGPAVGAAGALVLGLAAVGRVGPRALLAQLRPVRWFAVLVLAFQWWVAGPGTAIVVAGSLVLAVAAAGLVTLTTRTQDLLDAVVAVLGPLRRFGVDPQRAGLVLALAVRTVPVMAQLAQQVHQARVARGMTRSPRALVVPLVIRAVRHADRLGEALAARGVDDP
jgi:biotin transport system permease protein